MESKLQAKGIKFLKSQGCWVMKTRPGMGTPTATLDVVFFKEGFYGWWEFKASEDSPYRPGQKEMLEKFSDWSYAKAVYPENYDTIVEELLTML